MLDHRENHVAIIIMVVFLIVLAIIILWLIFARPPYPNQNATVNNPNPVTPPANADAAAAKDLNDKSGRYSGNYRRNSWGHGRNSGDWKSGNYSGDWKSGNYSGKDQNYDQQNQQDQQCNNGQDGKHIRMNSNNEIQELNPDEYNNIVDGRFSGIDMSEGESLYEERKPAGNRRKFHNK